MGNPWVWETKYISLTILHLVKGKDTSVTYKNAAMSIRSKDKRQS